MITKEQLNLLITHTIAITHQAFTIQCGEFATAIADDEANNLTVERFDLKTHISTFDYQPVLNSGYKDMAGLADEFERISQSVNSHELESLIQQLPPELACLTEPLTGEQLKPWIEYALTAEDQSPIYCLHQLFSGDSLEVDEPVSELIRQAIAFDELDSLEGVQGVTAEDIKLDDLNTAATIQSFKTLEWMLKHTSLPNSDILFLLSKQIDEPVIAKTLLSFLLPSVKDIDTLALQAKEQNLDPVYKFLRQQ